MAKYYKNHDQQISSSRTLEITVLSGEDLRINKRSIKKNTFVIVRSGGDDFRSTEFDGEGGSYPRWNERLMLDAPAAEITIEVHCKTVFGDRVVGTASVPASDYSGGYLPESYLHFLSYRLRDSRGERNGIINISVRMNAPTVAAAAEKYTCSGSASVSQQVTVGVPVGKSNSGGVVTGVPVWLSSYNGKHV